MDAHDIYYRCLSGNGLMSYRPNQSSACINNAWNLLTNLRRLTHGQSCSTRGPSRALSPRSSEALSWPLLARGHAQGVMQHDREMYSLFAPNEEMMVWDPMLVFLGASPLLTCDRRQEKSRPGRDIMTSPGSDDWLQTLASDIMEGSSVVIHDHEGDDVGRLQRLHD